MIVAALAAASVALTPGAPPQSFESLTAVPSDWSFTEYTPGVSKASIRRGHAADGKQYLSLIASKVNHTRLMIPVPVEANATYRVSAMVRTSAPQPVPALLALDGDTTTTTGNTEGDGRWHERDLYLQTGSSTVIGVVLSLGWFGQTVAGEADFDDVKIEKVDAAPSGAIVAKTPTAASTTTQASAPTISTDPGPNKATIPLVGLMVLLIAGTGGVLLRGGRGDD